MNPPPKKVTQNLKHFMHFATFLVLGKKNQNPKPSHIAMGSVSRPLRPLVRGKGPGAVAPCAVGPGPARLPSLPLAEAAAALGPLPGRRKRRVPGLEVEAAVRLLIEGLECLVLLRVVVVRLVLADVLSKARKMYELSWALCAGAGVPLLNHWRESHFQKY